MIATAELLLNQQERIKNLHAEEKRCRDFICTLYNTVMEKKNVEGTSPQLESAIEILEKYQAASFNISEKNSSYRNKIYLQLFTINSKGAQKNIDKIVLKMANLTEIMQDAENVVATLNNANKL